MSDFSDYIQSLQQLRHTGVPETSAYGPLQNLLNAAAADLKPVVQCVLHPKNAGAGIPDGGFFTRDQLKGESDNPFAAQPPARGVLEVKALDADIKTLAASAQVEKYRAHYGQVLVTNLREFALRGSDDAGNVVTLEEYTLGASEAEFWGNVADLREFEKQHAERLMEYLKRVLLHAAPLDNPEEVARFLASYARDARARLENARQAEPLAALAGVREALEAALGLEFRGERGEHFFRSTLIQTLFYGVFSAWVLWHKEKPEREDRFDWRSASHYLRVPVIQALFEQLALPSKLKPLGIMPLLDWTGAVLNRVQRPAFFARFQEEHAVQYFYEPFLRAFDPELRKELGVWYTPPEIVQYMVARVDAALRDELGIEDGLADKNVYVLDPCCGTGAYLTEVLRRIAQTLDENGRGLLAKNDLRQAATERVFGFEILPAPFVVAHLQLGLLLQNQGAPLREENGKNERAAVYLTNALTGWEPPSDAAKEQLALLRAHFPEMKLERDAADEIKAGKKILVVIGNPPYNGFAGAAMQEEQTLTRAYRTAKRAPKPQGQGLNDLYVRFFRIADRQIVEQTGRGVVCYISNYSWLDGLSFTGMRERYLETFDTIHIDCLNGDKYRTGKLTPAGESDPSAFSTPQTPEGIQVGTAIALLTRRGENAEDATVKFRHLWGKTKLQELKASADQNNDALYETLQPAPHLGLPFMPMQSGAEYSAWPLLTELFPVSFPGITTGRDDVVVDIDRDRLEARMKQYFDESISDEQLGRFIPNAIRSTRRFNAPSARKALLKRGIQAGHFMRYSYRPLDMRWLYWEPETKLLDEKRTDYFEQVFEGNEFLFTTGRTRKGIPQPPLITTRLNDYNCMDSGARGFPLYLRQVQAQHLLSGQDDELHGAANVKPNLSARSLEYLSAMEADAAELFYHVIAVLHAPEYRAENAGALRQDWPRVPLPQQRERLETSARLGREVARLLDSEKDVSGVTSGKLRPKLRVIAAVARADGKNEALDETTMKLTAGWGHFGTKNAVMPGQGKIVAREYSEIERALLGEAVLHLGENTRDIYLNETAYWQNVPSRVWEYSLGGYQVLKKWLSYREAKVLGRALHLDEIEEAMKMARRIAALLLMETELDANYRACCVADE